MDWASDRHKWNFIQMILLPANTQLILKQLGNQSLFLIEVFFIISLNYWFFRIKCNYRSVALLLQVSLPLVFFGSSASVLHLKGGTNAEMAPQVDFMTEIFRPNLNKFGASFDFTLEHRGYSCYSFNFSSMNQFFLKKTFFYSIDTFLKVAAIV